jgi:hypothetical protein
MRSRQLVGVGSTSLSSLVSLGVAAASAALAIACGTLLSGKSGDETAAPFDAAAEGTAPASGFTIAVTPPHAILDPTDAVDVKVSIARATGFTDAVDVAVQGQGADIVTNPPSLAFAGELAEASLSIKASDAAKPGDVTLSLIGVSRPRRATWLSPRAFCARASARRSGRFASAARSTAAARADASGCPRASRGTSRAT